MSTTIANRKNWKEEARIVKGTAVFILERFALRSANGGSFRIWKGGIAPNGVIGSSVWATYYDTHESREAEVFNQWKQIERWAG